MARRRLKRILEGVGPGDSVLFKTGLGRYAVIPVENVNASKALVTVRVNGLARAFTMTGRESIGGGRLGVARLYPMDEPTREWFNRLPGRFRLILGDK